MILHNMTDVYLVQEFHRPIDRSSRVPTNRRNSLQQGSIRSSLVCNLGPRESVSLQDDRFKGQESA